MTYSYVNEIVTEAGHTIIGVTYVDKQKKSIEKIELYGDFDEPEVISTYVIPSKIMDSRIEAEGVKLIKLGHIQEPSERSGEVVSFIDVLKKRDKEHKDYSSMLTIKELKIEEGFERSGEVLFEGMNIVHAFWPSTLRCIPTRCFKNCHMLESIEIPEGVRYIYNSAFAYCESLKDVSIPASAELLYAAAFASSGISKVEFRGDNLKSIGNFTFENCTNLERFDWPSQCKKIETRVFKGCTKLTKVNIDNELDEISADAFENSGIKELDLSRLFSVPKITNTFSTSLKIIEPFYLQ